MYRYLLINSKTLFAQQFLRTIQAPDKAVWELNFADDYFTDVESNRSSTSSICNHKDDWSLNYEIERAFLNFKRFDEVIFFPGNLIFGPLEAISSNAIEEYISRQIIAVTEIYRILADRLASQHGCKVTQVIYEKSYEFTALSSLPCMINSALQGLIEGLGREFSEMGIEVTSKNQESFYKDFMNKECLFINDLKLIHYQPLVTRHLEGVGRLFEGRK
ncbi:hypothetical protein [Aliidiomarina soli]|uniref:Uncharacterized protein n=1 Tax=Aliidiomarina soli TaxID=1928574 RepID=A0A432WJB8_9GAMM|nr:hypothetical protein [Aliidiomarina soli]RUO33821.1 hypothetical protein CWE14_04985 [Aliidiomarina soli]